MRSLNQRASPNYSQQPGEMTGNFGKNNLADNDSQLVSNYGRGLTGQNSYKLPGMGGAFSAQNDILPKSRQNMLTQQ